MPFWNLSYAQTTVIINSDVHPIFGKDEEASLLLFYVCGRVRSEPSEELERVRYSFTIVLCVVVVVVVVVVYGGGSGGGVWWWWCVWWWCMLMMVVVEGGGI